MHRLVDDPSNTHPESEFSGEAEWHQRLCPSKTSLGPSDMQPQLAGEPQREWTSCSLSPWQQKRKPQTLTVAESIQANMSLLLITRFAFAITILQWILLPWPQAKNLGSGYQVNSTVMATDCYLGQADVKKTIRTQANYTFFFLDAYHQK